MLAGGGGGRGGGALQLHLLFCKIVCYGLHHNVLCLGFVVVLYSIYGLYAVITTNFLDTCTPIKYTKYTTWHKRDVIYNKTLTRDYRLWSSDWGLSYYY